MTNKISRCSAPLAGLIALCVVAELLLPSPAPARQKPWLQQLREFVGHNPRLAPGGSRGVNAGGSLDPANTICLISPRIDSTGMAVVALPSPTLLSQQPLAEWRLENSQGRKLASALARSDRPIEGPIVWPLPPLQPGQTLLLRLRSLQASGSDYVDVPLRAASAAEQATALQRLNDHRDRLDLVQELLRQGKPSLALELVFAAAGDPSPALLELRSSLIREGCRTGS